MTELSFIVYGIPRPQGSLRPVTNRKTGKTLLVPQLKGVEAWKKQVAYEAWAGKGSWRGPLIRSPVELDLAFWLPKPKKAAHAWPRADLDKLVRAVGDALTGVVYKDDAQIMRITASKDYARPDLRLDAWCGVAIRVKALA